MTLLYSFPIRSDISLSENCDGDGATSIREMIRSDVTNLINAEVKGELNDILQAKYLGQNQRYPARSCREILELYPDTESGYFWLRNPAGRVLQAYCNMEIGCGPDNNITGWMQVANIDVTDPTQECPTGNFLLRTGTSRYCIRSDPLSGCDSSIFTVNEIPYTQVCGRATGIQIGTVDAFLDPNPMRSIEMVYTDGISLTYGRNPRNHIWTFAASLSEVLTTCPCSNGSDNLPPAFVGMDYFCEAAATTGTVGNSVFPNDALWDGELCRNVEMPCCEGDFSPPWFYRMLNNSQTADIEMRLCISQGGDENVGLEALELYVQ
jgi:hypothetical protein